MATRECFERRETSARLSGVKDAPCGPIATEGDSCSPSAAATRAAPRGQHQTAPPLLKRADQKDCPQVESRRSKAI
eukprot:3513388-Pleurochrysis_carterae.AAC.1